MQGDDPKYFKTIATLFLSIRFLSLRMIHPNIGNWL
jgi:hypothetical protein